MKRILIMGDLHAGALTGLTPPRYHSDEWRYLQEPFWNWYTDTLERIGPVDAAVFNGDLIHGPGKKETADYLTTDTGQQKRIAIGAIEMVDADTRFFTHGTSFHVVSSENLEDEIAKHFGEKCRDVLRLEVNGIRFNIRHHSGRSSIPYGQGTPTFRERINDLLESEARDFPAADVIIRNHVHYGCTIQIGDHIAATCAGLELPGSIYGRRMSSAYYHVGMMLVEIDERGPVIRHELMPLQIVTKEEDTYICLDR